MEYARKAIDLDAEAHAAHFQLGKAYARREDWQKSVAALEKAVALHPSSSSYYYVLGSAYRGLGKSEESRQAMLKFQELEKQAAEFEKNRRGTRDTGGHTP
jgi:Flp pilus assembly protein TadD